MIEHKLFNCIDSVYQSKLIEHIREFKLKKGDALFWEGEQVTFIPYVKSGHLKVFRTSMEGDETIFDLYDPHSFIALGTLFTKEHEYPASCVAVEDTIVYGLEFNLLEEAIVATPDSAKVWIGYMNRRLVTVQKKLTDMIFDDGQNRLRKLLKYFYKKYPNHEVNGYIHIDVPITKQEMADILNIRRETLSRMLSTLKKEHICECGFKEIVVHSEWLFNEV